MANWFIYRPASTIEAPMLGYALTCVTAVVQSAQGLV